MSVQVQLTYASEGSARTIVVDCFVLDTSYIGVEGGTNYPVACSQGLTLAKSVGVTWSSVVAVSQSLTSSYAVASAQNFAIGVSQALTSAFSVAVEWSSNAGLSQSLSTVYTVTVSSVFGVAATLGVSGGWAVDVSLGVAYVADLVLGLVFGSSVYSLYTDGQYATKGFMLASVCVGLITGVPLFILIVRRR